MIIINYEQEVRNNVRCGGWRSVYGVAKRVFDKGLGQIQRKRGRVDSVRVRGLGMEGE